MRRSEVTRQWHCPAAIPATQSQLCAQRDQRGRAIADWRTIGHIAADRARIAHLQPADAPDQFAKIRMKPRAGGMGIGIAHHGTKNEASRRFRDRRKPGNPTQKHHRVEFAQALGHP